MTTFGDDEDGMLDTPTPRAQRMAERRRFGLKELSIIAILALNFGALVWGAAKMSSAIDSLRDAVTAINGAHKDYDVRLRLIENEVAVTKAKIFLLETSLRVK